MWWGFPCSILKEGVHNHWWRRDSSLGRKEDYRQLLRSGFYMLELWHQRFGHANFKQVAKVSKFEAVEGLPKFGKVEKAFCGACQMGKQTKASHHKVNVITSSWCLELLHVDLMRPTRTESLGGKRYIMVIVDDFSRYTWVEFLREKSEACENWKFLDRKSVV